MQGSLRAELARVADAPLGRRFVWVAASRLCILAFLLAMIALVNLKGSVALDSFTTQLGSVTLAAAFALTALTVSLSRRTSRLRELINVHLCADQLIWTVVVYLSGGAASGATSFYGLTCLTGALLGGTRGALGAAVAGSGAFCLLLVGLGSGFLPFPPDQPRAAYAVTTAGLVASGVVNVLAMGVVTFLGGILSERLRVAGGRLMAAEQRASQAERMAALGLVAAGLAHEIRNPLGSIAGSIRLLRDNEALGSEDRQLCDIIVRETARLTDLVTDMVDLSNPRRPAIEPVDVVLIAREVVRLGSDQGRGVSDVLITYRGAQSATVRADPAQVRQLIWNLVRNGVQAAAAGGRVEVGVQICGSDAELWVTDNGSGLDEEARRRIFDAFFTTRSRGTGIGLAVVKRIADEHRFQIDVTSEPGGGATFRVMLGAVGHTSTSLCDARAPDAYA